MTQNHKWRKIKNDPNFVELSRESVGSQKKFRREPAESIKVRRVSNKKMSQIKKCPTLKKSQNKKHLKFKKCLQFKKRLKFKNVQNLKKR